MYDLDTSYSFVAVAFVSMLIKLRKTACIMWLACNTYGIRVIHPENSDNILELSVQHV